jgi:serine/threonine protein kinase
MPIGPGPIVGPYEVTGPLGEGGIGVVFRARDVRLQRDVALKLLPATAQRMDADGRTLRGEPAVLAEDLDQRGGTPTRSRP